MSTPKLLGALGDPLTLPVGPTTVQQLCPRLGEGQSIIVYNPDLINTAYVGYQNSGLATTNTVPVAPLGSATLDASRTIYGFCPTATINLTVVPGGLYINPAPSQIAQQIAINGAPLVNANTLISLDAFPSLTVPVGTPFSKTITGITGTGYVGSIGISSALNAFAQIKLVWQDATGEELGHQTYWITPGTIATPHVVKIKGPVMGPVLVWTVTAFVNTITYFDGIFMNSILYDRHDWRTDSFTLTNNTGILINSWIFLSSLEVFILPATSIGAGLTNTYILPLFTGRIRLWAFSTGAAGDMTLAVNNYSNQAPVISNQEIWGAKSDANSTVSQEFSLSRSQSTLAITNHNAAAQNIQAALIGEEY